MLRAFIFISIVVDLTGGMHRPKLIKDLRLKGPVSGMTMYKDELFIIRCESTAIDAFNSTSLEQGSSIKLSKIGEFQTQLKTEQTQNYCGLQDITSCKKNGFLYVSNWQNSIIHRIDPVSRSLSGSWEVKNGDTTALAVTQNGNLLVSCAGAGKVLEYTFDGKLVREINFDCNGDGPLHAMQLAGGQFVVCHGGGEAVRGNERLTIIDKHGNSTPDAKPLDFEQPCHLAVDANNRVLIAARGRSKLILWDPIKGSSRVLISSDQEILVPTKIHLNESDGQLLMLFRNSRLVIYQLKSDE